MSKRTKSRSGSMLLKFSNTSITSARASHARGSIDLSEYAANGGVANGLPLKRRKFFNSSTELYHVLSLMLMNLCRQVTSRCYLRRRLLAYCALTLLGGIAHDFVPSLPRALLLGPARTSLLNSVFVKYGWAWNLALLVPLVGLAGYAFRGLVGTAAAAAADDGSVQLDRVEASIEQYHDRRLKQLLAVQQQQGQQQGQNTNGKLSGASSQPSTSSSSSAQLSSSSSASFAVPPPAANKTIVTLQSISSSATAPVSAIEAYQKRILEAAEKEGSTKGIISKVCKAGSMLLCSDLLRLVINSALYYAATSAFLYIGGKGNDVSTNAVATVTSGSGSTENLSSSTSPKPQRHAFSSSSSLDISGHTFILVFSNLIFLEECHIMSGWEPLGDRLYDLSREYMNLEMDSWAGTLGLSLGGTGTGSGSRTGNGSGLGSAAEVNRRLYLAWHRFHRHTAKLRLLFALVTLLSLLWDLMLLQTACFFHTLIEKVLALGVAVFCWFLAYKVLFPLLGLEVKKPAYLMMMSSSSSSSSTEIGSPGLHGSTNSHR